MLQFDLSSNDQNTKQYNMLKIKQIQQMSTKSIDPSKSNDWSFILKAQDQYSRLQDLRHKQQEQLHKRLYKQQLESLISQQKHRQKDDKLQQQKHLQYMTQKQNTIALKELQQRQKWQSLRENFSQDNYYSSQEKKKKDKQLIEDEKKRFSERFRKISTELSQEREHEKRSYSVKQHHLAVAYDQQLSEQNKRKLLNRQEEIKLEALAKRLEDEKEKQRQNTLNKIRFGYGQNQYIYNVVNEATERRQNQRINFIQKIANPDKTTISNEEQDSSMRKSDLRKQTSNYNREQFEKRNFRKRIEMVEETLNEKEKFRHINEILQQENRQKSQEKERQRRQLQSELERQIQEYEMNKMRTKFMNPEESKINSSIIKKDRVHSGSLLPGVAYDHKLEKQQKLIERFLGGSQQISRISTTFRE